MKKVKSIKKSINKNINSIIVYNELDKNFIFVNDTIRMYKKWKIKMYNCVHSYIHFNAFFFDTINSRNGGEKNSKFERSKNMFGNVRFKT